MDEARRSRLRVRAEHPNQQRLRAMQTNDVAYANGVPGLRVEMTYDGQSRRVRKVEKSFSAQNNTWSVTSDTRYLYDGWNMIAELESNAAVPAVSGATVPVALTATHAWGLDLSGTTTGAGGVGGLVFTALYSTTQTTANNSQRPPTSVLAPCYDGNGNVLAYCDAATGQPLGRYEYDPFGRLLLREEDPRIAGRAAHLFSTKYLDAETGLSYYGYRFYCAEWGRWLNRDPIAEEGGANVQAFVENTSIGKIDRLGLADADFDRYAAARRACKKDCDYQAVAELQRVLGEQYYELSKQLDLEIGGLICCGENGRVFYGPISVLASNNGRGNQSPDNATKCPYGSFPAAWWHTHGANPSPPSQLDLDYTTGMQAYWGDPSFTGSLTDTNGYTWDICCKDHY